MAAPPPDRSIVKGGLIYTVVAKANVVLVDFAMARGTYGEVIQHMLAHIPTADTRKSLSHQQYIFHYMVTRGIVFLTMADSEYGHRLPFLFLEDIQSKFFGTYTKMLQEDPLIPKQFEGFQRVLKEQMDFFTNKPHEVDKLTAARQEVANVQKIVTNNIEKVLERGEKIEVLVEQTEQLGNTSHTFRKQAKVVKKKMCLKNMKWTIIAVVIVVLIVVILFVLDVI